MSRIFLVVVCAFWPLIANASEPFEPNTLVVRFAHNSDFAQQWIASNRTAQFEEFLPIIGEHTSEGFILDATLQCINEAFQRRQPLLKTNNTVQPVALIAVFRYSASISPIVAARKISSFEGVAYAEPYYRYAITSTNDPLRIQQYHLDKIQAEEAWDLLPNGNPVIVGIVDTGIDTLHEDLRGQIWKNPGEHGVDGFGFDKRTNGRDDDNNGFVDDYFGWDFAGRDGLTTDNVPLPGNLHGTHVAGIVAASVNNSRGVAGVAQNVRVVPIKVGVDNPFAQSVIRTPDGILYGAGIGARVINCSFGSSSASEALREVVQTATQLGALVVGAAGNDFLERAFYPAAFPEVLSVVSTDEFDKLSLFSNWHQTVDVCAPGTGILSTVVGNDYDFQDGTSMAAPVAAGVAAMVLQRRPQLNPSQLHGMMKANTDFIDPLNERFAGLIGTGRVNAFKAVSLRRTKFVELLSVTISDKDADNLLAPGDVINISVSVINQLDPVASGSVSIVPVSSTFTPKVVVGSASIGAIPTLGLATSGNEIEIEIPTDVEVNATLSLQFVFLDGTDTVGTGLFKTSVNPSFRTISENNVTLTATSEGNIGYNDYPDNNQGVGVSYKDSPSFLFEGAFLVGNSPSFVLNNARSADPSFRDDSFVATSLIRLDNSEPDLGTQAVSVFNDSREASNLGLEIQQTVIQETADSLADGYVVVYDINNTTSRTIENVHAALFMDWDMSAGGADDGCAWQPETGIGFVRNTRNTSVPIVGVRMLSDHPNNFFAVDNGGGGGEPGIYDGFFRNEKWYMMSSGIRRTNSTITDVSMLIGAGPFTLQPNEPKQVVFAVSFGSSYAAIGRNMIAFKNYSQQRGLNAVDYSPLPTLDEVLFVENGPTIRPGQAVVHYSLQKTTGVILSLVDVAGRTISTLLNDFNVLAGVNIATVDIPNVATGTYLITMQTQSGLTALPIQIVP